jgi:hypothetical protein
VLEALAARDDADVGGVERKHLLQELEVLVAHGGDEDVRALRRGLGERSTR